MCSSLKVVAGKLKFNNFDEIYSVFKQIFSPSMCKYIFSKGPHLLIKTSYKFFGKLRKFIKIIESTRIAIIECAFEKNI